MCNSRICCFVLSTMFVAAAIAGCSNSRSAPSIENASDAQAAKTGNEQDAEIASAMAELTEEDRVAASAQKFCAVEQENLLGSMGAPFKLVIEGKPVFLCCEGCKDAALKDPQATLAVVAKLKASPSPGK